MSAATLQSPLSFALSSSAFQEKKPRSAVRSAKPALILKPQRSLSVIRAAANFSSSLDIVPSTELDAVTSYSEIVPDTVIFDDFERLFISSLSCKPKHTWGEASQIQHGLQEWKKFFSVAQ